MTFIHRYKVRSKFTHKTVYIIETLHSNIHSFICPRIQCLNPNLLLYKKRPVYVTLQEIRKLTIRKYIVFVVFVFLRCLWLLGQGQSSVHDDKMCVCLSDFSRRSKRGACAAAGPERRASHGAGRHAGGHRRPDQVRKFLFFFLQYNIWFTVRPVSQVESVYSWRSFTYKNRLSKNIIIKVCDN